MSGLLVTALQSIRVLQDFALAAYHAVRRRPRRAAAPRRFLATLHLALLAALVFTFLPRVPGTAQREAAAMPPPAAIPLMISQFRLRGPYGDSDEFVEIYNNSDSPHTVAATSGTGYGLAASDGWVRFSIPNGTIIPARGHFLGVNAASYTLSAYPAGNGTTANGDATYGTDIPDNAGIALFKTNLKANLTLANRLDAVGSSVEANPLYKEGNGYPAITALYPDSAFIRDRCGDGGSTTDPYSPCGLAGIPQDTDDNAADFIFIEPHGAATAAGQRLGAAGPANLSSPVCTGNNTLPLTLLDPQKGAFAAPNFVRDTSFLSNNNAFGSVDIRRVVTNNTGKPVTRLRFRVIDLSTIAAPNGYADLRPQTAYDGVVPVAGVGNVTVTGTTLELPPSQPSGGGFNSSLSVGAITLSKPLAPGQSLPVHFSLGVQQTGPFKLTLETEALPGGCGQIHLVGFDNGPFAISATAGKTQSAQINSVFPTTLAASVALPKGRVAVVFSAPASGASGIFPFGVTTVTVTSDASGKFTAPPFTANGIAGSYTVTARVVDSGTDHDAAPATAKFALTNTPDKPTGIVVTGGAPQSAAIGAVFPVALRATVRDAGNKTLPGQIVTFSVPASGASGTFAGGAVSATVTSDASGVATAPAFTANGIAGSYVVAASVAGVATPASFALTNLAIPPAGYAVTVSTTGAGSVSPGSGTYSGTVEFTATPADAGQLFLGWTVDGHYVGFGNPLALPVTAPRTVEAAFAPRPTFADVATDSPAAEAIAQLAARGIVKGYGDGNFGPTDGVLRAQIAALIVRMMGWQTDPGTPPPFTDLATVDPELQQAIAALAAKGVLKGYGDGTFGPTNELLHIQVVLVISRAMVAEGYWAPAAADDQGVYPNVQLAPSDRLDLMTFVRHAGPLPDRPAAEPWADWDSPASRGWTARLLWQAYAAYFSTNHLP